MSIPQAVHQQLIGRNGRLIRAICAECNGVSVHFPPPGIKSDDVVIRGAAKDIESAKKQLSELAKEKVRLGSARITITVLLYCTSYLYIRCTQCGDGTARLYSTLCLTWPLRVLNTCVYCTQSFSYILYHTVVQCTCSIQSIHVQYMHYRCCKSEYSIFYAVSNISYARYVRSDLNRSAVL